MLVNSCPYEIKSELKQVIVRPELFWFIMVTNKRKIIQRAGNIPNGYYSSLDTFP